MKIKITLIEKMLGTKSSDVAMFEPYVADKCPDEELKKQEMETAKRMAEEQDDDSKKGVTIFHKTEDGELMIMSYQIKGFLKHGGEALRQCEKGENKLKRFKAIKTRISDFVFVYPREIRLGVTKPDYYCNRQLRADAIPPRVMMASSETVNAGISFECDIRIFPGAPVTEKMVEKILDYGQFYGLGQWRNSGFGAFDWEKIGE